MSARHLLALAACALAACGEDGPGPVGANDYPLSGATPYPERATSGDRVRNIVVRYEVTRPSRDRREVACALSTLLFDVTTSFSLVPIATMGECRLYASPPEAQYDRQRAVCAGAIGLEGDSLSTQVGFCPSGSRPPYEQPLTGCGALTGGRAVRVQSLMDEGIPEDAVTDLSATVTLPSEVTITGPSDLPVTTWPDAGDLAITWTSAGATSALVRLAPVDTSGGAGAVVVCTPRTNGRVTVPQSLIATANLRAQEVRVRVLSLRDVTTTAEGGEYRISGATVASLVLQRGR